MFSFINNSHSRHTLRDAIHSFELIKYNELLPLLNLARATPQTYFDENDIMQTAEINQPAIGKYGLALFQSRTNYLSYSQNISMWGSHINTSITLTDTAAPDGTRGSVYRLNRQSTSPSYRRHPNFQKGSANSETLTASIFIKKSDARYFALRVQNNGYSNHGNAVFDLDNIAVSSTSRIGLVTDVSAAIIDCGNGWYRCSMTFTAKGGNADIDFVVSFNQGNRALDGTDISSICGGYLWGAQVENGSIPTPYIPTNGSQQTRAAQIITSTNADFASYFNSAEGTFIFDFTPMAIKSVSQILLNITGSSGNRIFLELYSNGNLNLGYEVNGNFNFHGLGIVSTGKNYRLVFSYKDGNLLTILSNGIVLERSHTIPAVGNINALSLGSASGGNFPADLFIKKLSYIPTRITNSNITQFFDFTTGGDSFMDGAGGIGIRQSLSKSGYSYWDTAVGGSTLAAAAARLETLSPRNKVIFCDGSVNGHGSLNQDMAEYQKIYDLAAGNVIFIAPTVFPNMVGSEDEIYTITLTNTLINTYGDDKVINMTAIAQNLAGTTDRNSITYRSQFQADGVHPGDVLTDAVVNVIKEKL